MDIKRGKYILRSDASCCWIEDEAGKNISGYYPSFRMLADIGLPRHLMLDTEAKSMKKLIEDVRKMEEKIAKMTAGRIDEILNDLGGQKK